MLHVSLIIVTTQKATKTSCLLPVGKACIVCISHHFVRCIQENIACNLAGG
jgi:hypothetical protein